MKILYDVRCYLSLKNIFYTLSTVFLLSAIFTISFASDCRQMSADEAQRYRDANIQIPPNSLFCNTAIEKTTQASLAAKEYLMTKLTGGAAERGRSSIYGDQYSSGLNSLFACRAAEFIKAAEKQGFGLKITSAYRSPQFQMSVVKGRKCSCTTVLECLSKCPHVKGIAIDLTFDGKGQVEEGQCQGVPACRWADENAEKYGLVRLRPKGGCVAEPWHFELRGAGGCGTRSDNGGDINPEVLTACGRDGKTYPPAQSGASPSSGTTESARNFLSGLFGQNTQQQTAAQQQAVQCAMQGGSWYTLNYSTGQGYCQPGTNQQPQLPTSAQTTSAQPSSSGTSGTSGTTAGTSNTTNTTSTKPDPVLACAQQASNPVCGKQTTCPSLVSPNAKCSVGGKKTYLNTCLMNVDNAQFVSQGACPQTTQDELDALAQGEPKKDEKKPTTVTLVEDPAATVDSLGDKATNAFTAAPKPGTPSYDHQRLTPTQPVSQQTFTDANSMPVPGVFSNTQTNTTFVATALTNIVSALNRLQQLLTPMRYTTTQSSEDGMDGDYAEAEFINEEGIDIYVE